MASSSRRLAFAFAAVVTAGAARSTRAEAQQPTQGFAVERLYLSAPGGGWLVMDDLSMHGGLGGAVSLTTGYARNPLRVTDGTQHVAVVSDEAFADFGFAATVDRLRLYLNFDVPLDIEGSIRGVSNAVGTYGLASPAVHLGSNPDTLSDVRIGFDARLLGSERSPFRLGAGVQVIAPSGQRSDYDTDGTYRVMGRFLFAGDVSSFAYAGQLGVHVRPLDDSPAPGSPQGSELLFGLAAGPKFLLCGSRAIVVGPEIYGETAFRSFLGTTGTGLEALLTGRLEGTDDRGPQVRLKVATGGGINAHFGAPEWRFTLAVEVFDHNAGRPAEAAAQP
jgi:hypothetical protein